MIFVALLFSVLCHSQSNEEHVAALEERVTTLEAKIKQYMLEIVLLVKKDNATIKKTTKIMNATTEKVIKGINMMKETFKKMYATNETAKKVFYGEVAIISVSGFILLYAFYLQH